MGKIILGKLLFLLGFLYSAVGQNIYSGIVVNNKTKAGIPYATVGLINENKGISADEKGNFSISSTYQNDSLKITCVGYQNAIFSLQNITNKNTIIELKENPANLKEVIIANKLKNDTILHNFNGCSSHYYLKTNQSSHQLALIYYSPQPNMQLSELTICKEPVDCLFRIHIYTKDAITESPSTELNDTVIEVRSSLRKVKVDMEKYKIVIPGKEFYVAIEWVIIPLNIDEIRSVKFKERKLTYTSYQPGISFRYKKNKNDSLLKENMHWLLDYNGKWTLLSTNNYSKYDFLISAKMKY